jgi:hypothetical protein
MIPCPRFHLSEKERPNTLLSQRLHFRRPPDNLAKGMQSVSGSMFGVADTLTQQAGIRARLRELASVRRRFGYRRFTFCSHADLIH